MKVNFKSNEQAVKLPQLKPFEGESVPVETKKQGFMDKSVELWANTLKIKASADSYAGGLWRGAKYGAFTGAVLTGMGWFGKSIWNIRGGSNTVGHMVGTLFTAPAKALAFVAGAFGSLCKKDGITLVQFAKKTCIDLPAKAFKKVCTSKNVPTAIKWIAPTAAALVFGYTTFRSVLRANEEKARIDHRYHVGHYEK